eukprot:Skav214636  [mRNA]  locus=scaffold1009:89644:102191:- [translate_table: standard]
MGVKENMRCQFGEILDEINHRQSHLDFSELLESLKTTRLGFGSALITGRRKVQVDFTPVLRAVRECKQDSAFHLEMFCVGSYWVKVFYFVQTCQLTVDYTMKDLYKFMPWLYRSATTGLSPSGRPNTLTCGVQETVFELLSAFRDQCTDTGELNDNLVRPQVKIDLAPVSKMVEETILFGLAILAELHLKVDHLDEVHDRLVHTVEEQAGVVTVGVTNKARWLTTAQGQDHLHEVVGEVSEATQRRDALQQRPTTEELDHRLASVLQALQAASADQIDRNSLEVLLREQMQRHKKDLQSSIDLAPLMTSLRDTQEMTQGVSSAVRSLRAAGASIGAGEIGPNSTAEISPEMLGSSAVTCL